MSNERHDDGELDEIWTTCINGILADEDLAQELHDRVHPVAEMWYRVELLSGMALPYPKPNELAQFCFCLGGMMADDAFEDYQETGHVDIGTLIVTALMVGVEVGQAFENCNGLLKDLWDGPETRGH